MSPPQRKRRGERFVSRPGDSQVLKPGEEPRRPSRPRPTSAPVELGALRRARDITQMQLADAMGVDQAQVSRVESREDSRLSTVLEYLKGLGAVGVELRIVFEDGTETTLPVELERAGAKR